MGSNVVAPALLAQPLSSPALLHAPLRLLALYDCVRLNTLRLDDSHQFGGPHVIGKAGQDSQQGSDRSLNIFEMYEQGLLATWETPDALLCVPEFRI
jgi:hypothetical protein